MAYHKVTSKAILAKVNEHFKMVEKAKRRADKWRKKYGGTSLLLGIAAHFDGQIYGIVADTCPGPEWCSAQTGQDRWWRPRRTKIGKAIHDEMRDHNMPCTSMLFPVLGYKPNFLEGIGYIHHKKGDWFVFQTLDRVEYDPPRGVRRITDILYQKLGKAKNK